MQSSGSHFRNRIDAADQKLTSITEEQASEPRTPGWKNRKEELGHLLDSAANNHLRFVFAAVNGEYTGPTYNQRGWVDLHRYHDLHWRDLLDQWRMRNHWLAHVVEGIPDSAMEASCRVGSNEPVTLRFLIDDYLRHLDHHVNHIVEPI
ncbi:MAG TPA: DinB family protein [Bryobacteraceae bacterium]|nr:DinB family protein [Bryobacteraceae bacterium]